MIFKSERLQWREHIQIVNKKCITDFGGEIGKLDEGGRIVLNWIKGNNNCWI
jgi:hypothetical protein